MESHRTPSQQAEIQPTGRGRRAHRRDREPLDAAWLEREGLRHVARWESSRRGVAERLERKLRERCARTGEDPTDALALLDEVVEGLVRRRYVDDRRYANLLVERARKQGRSRARLRGQLEAKGIDDDVIRAIFERDAEEGAETTPDPDRVAAWTLARKRGLGPYCSDPERREALRERHLGIFARGGFDYETALAVVDASAPPEDD